jgi:transposase InsO family protein
MVEKPGEGVQLDVKYVYAHGIRHYQFSVFDPFTEKYHFTIFPTKESKNAIGAFKKSEKYFGFRILSVQTDNGSEFRGYFHKWLGKKSINIPHYFIPKSSPYWNAQVERVHKTIDDEFYHNPYRAWDTPYEWLQYYNFERIHLTLNGLTPQEKLLQSVTLDC